MFFFKKKAETEIKDWYLASSKTMERQVQKPELWDPCTHMTQIPAVPRLNSSFSGVTRRREGIYEDTMAPKRGPKGSFQSDLSSDRMGSNDVPEAKWAALTATTERYLLPAGHTRTRARFAMCPGVHG